MFESIIYVGLVFVKIGKYFQEVDKIRGKIEMEKFKDIDGFIILFGNIMDFLRF